MPDHRIEESLLGLTRGYQEPVFEQELVFSCGSMWRVESCRLLAVSHSAMPDLYLMFHFNGRVCRAENHCQSLAVLFRSLFGPSMVEAFMVGVSSVSQCDACSGPALCSEGCPWFPDAPSARRLPHFGCRDECTASKTGLFVLFGCFILVWPSFDAKN